MHGNDSLRFFGYSRFDQRFINIHGIGTDIHKYGHGSPEHKGVRRGNKGIGGHDNLVSRLNVGKQRRKLRGMGAGGGKQALACARPFLNPFTAFSGKFPVAADFLVFHGLPDIVHFFSRKGRYVEPNHSCRLSFFILNQYYKSDSLHFQKPEYNFLYQASP